MKQVRRSHLKLAPARRADDAAGRTAAAVLPPPGPPGSTGLDERARRRALEQVLGSPDFDAAPRSRELLVFVVEEALAGRGEAVTQSAIATRVFGRKDDFDPTVDPIVRIQAGRLRRSLERYYLLSGRHDPVRIDLPKGGYVPVFRAMSASGAPSARVRPAEAPGDGWPHVALTDFEVTASGPGSADLAIQVTEELALELGRYRTVRVLAGRNRDAVDPALRDGARFALGGRIRGDGHDLRVTARLVDRVTGEQVWGDEYQTAPQPGRWSGTPDDVARVIAARVGAEEGVIVQLLAAERRKRSGAPPTAYDAFLRSYDFFLARDPETLKPAIEALRQAVQAEPEFGLGWTRLARLYVANHTFEATPVPTPLEEAIAFAQNAVRVDPASRSARCTLASALIFKDELVAARHELGEALRTSPDSLVYLEVIGYLLNLLGDDERGPALSRSARARNPHCLPHVLFGLWVQHLRRGELELAHQAALEYRDPVFFWRAVMRASCLGLLGRHEDARLEVAELLTRKPDFETRGRILLRYYLKLPEVLERVEEGLARAGLTLD